MTSDPYAPLSVDVNDYCFFDTETRAINPGPDDDVTRCGLYRYRKNAKVVIFDYAIGDGPVKEWLLDDFDGRLHWRDAPIDLLEFVARAQKGKAWFVALNAAFDREVSNHGIVRPNSDLVLPVRTVIDASAQLQSSGLPGGLAQAARILNVTQKEAGKSLIKLFSSAGGATPQSEPAQWEEFRQYARTDVEALRDLFLSTRHLPRREWEEYWASENVNMRGLPVDRAMVEATDAMAQVFAANARAEIRDITGEDWGPHHHVALASWAYDKLLPTQPALCELMVKTYITDDSDPDGETYTVGKIGLDREKIEKVIARLEAIDADVGLTDDEADVLDMCEIKLYGAGAASAKFGRVLEMLDDDDRLRGQYVFNGAGQTGRFSSKGVQAHNMTRSWIGMEKGDTSAEEDAIVFLMDNPSPTLETMREFEARFGNTGRALSRLVRPIICPRTGKIISVDKSQIEARVLPWLARAESRLDIFREVDADPSLPDLYKRTAAATYDVSVDDVDKGMRQIGKVQELALGFAGGKGALISMAAAYRLTLDEERAQELVDIWRRNNQWAVDFWADVWDAFLRAHNTPGVERPVGRLTYLFDPDYLGGTMFCALPDGRLISYPMLRYSEVEKTDKFGETTVNTALTYMAGGNRRTLWKGILVENATQAAAASLLRRRVVDVEAELPDALIGHTHDELIAWAEDDEAEALAEAIAEIMERDLDWTEGLPQKADPEIQDWYSKVEE